ncbi:hypothetical protein CROQUDRAFT_663929 [Cronartium quercuum f. sp. fusiforme G11]|uniref:Uncharacterized protein n=1 Tax=Cronartium quercuum f. sp. fusiforme G11 TaxID=708437 RepID=A0A9P6NCN0_9BASI|nr:hypothetical protein CROQUDRAFT_663929 [Cronartium quercuum f. sp. fusiforme G11]
MSSPSTPPQQQQPMNKSKTLPPSNDQMNLNNNTNNHTRRPSLFSSILSLAIPPPSPSTSTATASSSSFFSTSDQSPTSSTSSNTSPISIPINDSQHQRRSSISSGFGSLTNGFLWNGPHLTPTDQTSSNESRNTNLPTRRSSISSTFRRPFELPNYSRVDESVKEENSQQRGRSGSLFNSSLNSTHNNDQSRRRKLSPMGERMIRDHPF